MALIFRIPLSPLCLPHSFPHVMESSGSPPVPNPILESQVWQSCPSLPMMPILALEYLLSLLLALNPSMLQFVCKDALAPARLFHVSRPNEVLRYVPSAIIEFKEVASLFMTVKLICSPIFIPRQILEKDVFQ